MVISKTATQQGKHGVGNNNDHQKSERRRNMKYISIDEIIDNIAKRRAFLRKHREIAEDFIAAAPKGRLSCRVINGKVRFYWRQSEAMSNGKYLSKKKMETITKLAQKQCAQKTLAAIDAELSRLTRCEHLLRSLGGCTVEEVFDNLNENIKNLASPVVESNDQFAERWMNNNIESDDFYEESKRLVTKSGEKVRSKSEMIISAILRENRIPFKYEQPLWLGDHMIRPDFTLLDKKQRKEIYWEHFGLADRPEYAVNALKKLGRFFEADIYAGATLIITVESEDMPLSEPQINKIIAYNIPGAA